MQPRYWTAVCAAAVGVSVVSSGWLSAQQAPARTSVTLVQVKADSVPAWREFQEKQTVPALKKIGVTQRDVYEPIYAPAGQFRVVQPLTKFADRDNPQGPIVRALGEAAARTYNEALSKMLVSSVTTIIESIADASYDPTPNTILPVLVLTRLHVAPGKVTEFQAYIH